MLGHGCQEAISALTRGAETFLKVQSGTGRCIEEIGKLAALLLPFGNVLQT